MKGYSLLGRHTYSVAKDSKKIGHIWIAYNVDWNEEDLCEVVIHEMVHHYVQMIKGHKGGLLGHNRKFKT